MVVEHDVTIVSVLHLQDVAEQRVRGHALDEVITSLHERRHIHKKHVVVVFVVVTFWNATESSSPNRELK